jgi:hypothetical protein
MGESWWIKLIISSLQQLLLQLSLEDLHLTIYRDAEFVLVNGLEVSHLGLMGELHLPGLDQIFHHFFQRSFRPHLSYTPISFNPSRKWSWTERALGSGYIFSNYPVRILST